MLDKKQEEKKGSAVFALKVLVSLVMIAMVLMVFVNAMLRYLVNGGIAEFEELSRYAFIWVSSLGAVIAYYQNKHVGVDLLIERLHGGARLTVLIIGELLVLFALVLMIYGSWGYFAATLTQDSAAIPVPLGVITVCPLVMSVAMLPKVVLQILKHVKAFRTEKTSNTEVEAKK